MIVDRLHITDYFLRRWLERVWGIDVDACLHAHFNRPCRGYDEADFLEMLRERGFDVAAMKAEAARLIGRAPWSGRVMVGVWIVLSKGGRAVTVLNALDDVA